MTGREEDGVDPDWHALQGRYVSLVRKNNVLTCIDSICFHAGGPLVSRWGTEKPRQSLKHEHGTPVAVTRATWHRILEPAICSDRIKYLSMLLYIAEH